MTKRKNKIKVKVSNNTTNTLIKVAGLGIVSYLAFKMLSNNEYGLAYLGGSSSGYTGSGTDFSGLGLSDFLPFMQETPPTFNISNPPIPSSFFINPDTVLPNYSIVPPIDNTIPPNTIPPDNTTKKDITVGNTSSSLLTNLFNPDYWLGSVGKDLPQDEYNLRSQNNSRYALFRTPAEFINAGVNPLGFLINRFKSTSGSGGGGGCSSGNCPTTNDTPFTIDLTTKKTAIINSGNTGVTAQSFLTSLRNEGIAPRTITYTQNIMTPMEYVDYYNKKLAVIEQNAQNKLAASLASGNCGPAISTNACTGATRTTNYSNIVSNTANQSTRYYENTIATTKKELITVEMRR